jgi:hypothetical protein
MASFTNDLGVKAKLLYRVKGKAYNTASGETAVADPFDEAWVQPGESVELGDLAWIQVLSYFGDEEKINKQIEDLFRNSSLG